MGCHLVFFLKEEQVLDPTCAFVLHLTAIAQFLCPLLPSSKIQNLVWFGYSIRLHLRDQLFTTLLLKPVIIHSYFSDLGMLKMVLWWPVLFLRVEISLSLDHHAVIWLFGMIKWDVYVMKKHTILALPAVIFLHIQFLVSYLTLQGRNMEKKERKKKKSHFISLKLLFSCSFWEELKFLCILNTLK